MSLNTEFTHILSFVCNVKICSFFGSIIALPTIYVFPGTLMGITNGVATIPGFLSPTVVGALTDGNVSSS